ncbi:sulfate adenylyltransferase subunit CysN [Rhizobium sp. F40D2]
MTSIANQYGTPDLKAYLDQQERKSFLRFLACGSVDDGKSTLIGRLLLETKSLYEDQIVSLTSDSKRHGTANGELDYALLLDGLEAEREQGITIDVAYRFFSTAQRKFIVADTPGHEEYTRNMATGASTADLAVVLVDARQGILTQTKRHTYIAALLGIRHVILAVNKMDLIGYDQAGFRTIASAYDQFVEGLGSESICTVPVSARVGDNIVERSAHTPWYLGKTLLEQLDTVSIDPAVESRPFRFPVQLVVRPDLDFRGFAGQVASGKITVGDALVVAKSGRSSRLKQIVTKDGLREEAREGDAVTLVLDDEIDVSRGNILVSPDSRPHVADQFQAHLIWFDHSPMIPGRSYILRTETDTVSVSITNLKYELNINTLAHDAAKSLPMNGIGVCNLSLSNSIVFDAYRENRTTGSFILLDRFTNATVGAGLIDFPLRRASNIHLQSTSLAKKQRSEMKAQKPSILWFTGLSGSGKSTIANRVESILHAKGRHTYLLDGDNVRHGLNRDLGFTQEDRVENIRRVAEVAKLMVDAGLIVLVAFISPFAAERRLARDLMEDGEFLEVFIDTPIEECARRDPKGLYKKARAGEIKNFTGINSPYEPPAEPDIHVQTLNRDIDDMALQIVEFLTKRG